jgi:hypothetical protein
MPKFSLLEKTMNTLQLPNFKNHPECATALITIKDARHFINRGWLTIEAARHIFPERVWHLLPQFAPEGLVLMADKTV